MINKIRMWLVHKLLGGRSYSSPYIYINCRFDKGVEIEGYTYFNGCNFKETVSAGPGENKE